MATRVELILTCVCDHQWTVSCQDGEIKRRFDAANGAIDLWCEGCRAVTQVYLAGWRYLHPDV